MEWSRQGLLVPAPPPLGWAASHAALPVVHLGERGRLFLTTRDAQGRSSIAAAELTAGAKLAVEGYAPEPVVEPGPLGAFDDAGVTSSCVVEADGSLLQYYTGWTLGVSVPFYFYVGCAISDDGGATFRKVSRAPLLERDQVDPFLTASPWVLVEGDTWRMWYVSGTGWEMHDGRPRHRYHLKYAESADGLEWRRTGHVCIHYADEREYAIGRPCVLPNGDGGYRMWFCARGDAYRLGYAESADGLDWERRDDEAGLDPSPDGWDSEMVAYPCVFDAGGKRHLLYNGNGYGATGIGWAVAGSA